MKFNIYKEIERVWVCECVCSFVCVFSSFFFCRSHSFFSPAFYFRHSKVILKKEEDSLHIYFNHFVFVEEKNKHFIRWSRQILANRSWPRSNQIEFILKLMILLSVSHPFTFKNEFVLFHFLIHSSSLALFIWCFATNAANDVCMFASFFLSFISLHSVCVVFCCCCCCFVDWLMRRLDRIHCILRAF